MNDPEMIIQAQLFTSNYTNRVVPVLFSFTIKSRCYIRPNLLIFGHVLTVNSYCYGRCYVAEKTYATVGFLKFHTHPRGKSGFLTGVKSCN